MTTYRHHRLARDLAAEPTAAYDPDHLDDVGRCDVGGPTDDAAPAGCCCGGCTSDERPLTPAEQLAVLSTEYHRVMADLLDAVLDRQAWETDEDVVGLTIREQLTLSDRLPGPLAARLEAVAHRLDAIPQVARRYRAGLLSFDQLAGFVRLTRRCHGPRLAQLDEQAGWLVDQLASEHRLADFDTEATALHESTRTEGHRDRAERTAMDGERLVRGRTLDGGGFIYSEHGPVGYALANAGIDAAADALQAADHGGTSRETSLARLRAAGLQLLAESFLVSSDGDRSTDPDAGNGDGGGGGADADHGADPAAVSGRRAPRPTIRLLVDWTDLTPDRGAVVLDGPGTALLPTLSARLTDTLADHAELLVEIRDGARPLAELRADDVPAPTRRAVRARDGGCRFPGCNVALTACHVHHVDGRDPEGRHDPDRLLTLCSQHHLRHVHRHGWRPDLRPLTGEVLWTHPSGRRLATMPRHHRPRPRPPDRLPVWRAPPIPEPPDRAPPARLTDPPSPGTDPPAGVAASPCSRPPPDTTRAT